ncbi:archaetidylserine decarboxylase [Sphingosinicella sp.]|uniref:archaetidylserine decarboxylase n=1 Tax=Sphingosinicella sp. TaxID=1917971 RepID=UPI0040379A74
MTVRHRLMGLLLRDDVNFALTNRLPRRSATRWMGNLSKIENPLVRVPSIALWRFFADPDLDQARETRFRSLHHAFTRDLMDGARPFDSTPKILASPCDAIVGTCGRVEAGRLYQVKGRDYALCDLLDGEADEFAEGSFVTLRLTAGMYHRFHAPHALTVEQVRYIPGDAWNVNRAALNRVERLYCRNERAVIAARLAASGHPILLVPVAAILVAGIRLHFAGDGRLLRDGGARTIPCDTRLEKGEEMGWFEHGSTMIVLAPHGFALADGIEDGARIRAGHALMRLP